MAKRCPSCRTEVPDDARVCPNCPWTFPDEESDNPPPSAVIQGWSPLPLAIAAAVLGLGWYFVAKAYHEGMLPEQPVPPPAAETSAPAALEQMPPKLAAAVSSQPRPAFTPAPAVKEDADDETVSVTVVKEPAPKPVREWKLRGFVYDLVTLQPAPRCKITLTDVETNTHFETATDAGGRYRTILPPLPDRGYLIDISAPGYVPAYLDPDTQGVRRKAAGERQKLCQELGRAVQQPSSLQPRGAEPLVTDFYIAPASCR
jgi:hypothetical protein